MADGEKVGWAILELMGHRKLAGMVKETTVAGGAFLRIDVCVPHDDALLEGEVAFEDDDGAPLKQIASQFYSPAAVYCITPTTRDMCLRLARRYQPEPVTRWELPAATEPSVEVESQEEEYEYEQH